MSVKLTAAGANFKRITTVLIDNQTSVIVSSCHRRLAGLKSGPMNRRPILAFLVVLGLSFTGYKLFPKSNWVHAGSSLPAVAPSEASPLSPPSPSSAPPPAAAVATSYAYYDALPDMIERVSPGVVNISSVTVINYQVYGMDQFMRLWGMPAERKQSSLGSGFIIDQDGYVITNNHVVEQATEVLVTLPDKRQFKAKIVGKDEKMDLALLQLWDSNRKIPANLKPVVIGNSDLVRIGETVVAVGNPFGLQNTVTRGIISAKNRTIGLGPFDNFLQTDASINPGNSGGPLFNIRGEVIGINSAIHSQTGQSSGLGFAIPTNEAVKLLPDLKRYGRIPRPWLGILGEKISPQLQHYYRIPTEKGVLIFNLVQGAPSDRAGLRQGDILLEIDGVETNETNDVEKLLAKHKPDEVVTVKVYRGNLKPREIKIQLEELPRLENLPRGIL
ncbi:MAG: trypsin-like peptidase domain-containing protein [Bdellovibrio sp.]|nr:trypsin-like peptidase domain-containing protein [Bdellovibrio sp.]